MLMEQLADYAIREQTSKLPPQVIHHAKRAVIDWYAALLPGSVVNPAKLMEEFDLSSVGFFQRGTAQEFCVVKAIVFVFFVLLVLVVFGLLL